MRPSVMRVGIQGAGGRMGTSVLALLEERADLAPGPRLGRGGAPSPEVLSGCDVVVDFSAPEASVALARAAAELGRPALVIGTTGFSPEQEEAVAEAARGVPVVKAGNFSLGVNLLLGLVEQAARALGPEYDIEVFEAHHRRKADAPSGTALMLGRAAAEGRGVDLTQAAAHDRAGARPQGAIGFSVVRGGGIVGEHSVLLAAEDEIVTLSHSARDRRLFARGALAAAAWVVGRPPGLYDMRDVLGLAGRA